MKVIHLLRKPCSEGTVAANVLRWGTGALNIDGCRVNGPMTGNWGGKQVSSIGYSGTVPSGFATTQHAGGRWPANLVLQHLPTCEQTGTREEPGYTVNRFTDGAKPFGGGAGHPYESEQVPPSTVPVWNCAPGCPVAGLDAQSLTGGMHGAGKARDVVAGGEYRASSFDMGGPRPMGRFGDTGGASRFFKQVGGRVTPSGGDRGGKG